MSEPHLVLASESPRRRALLQLLGLPFGVMVADVTERARVDETPAELVTRLSRAKADAASRAEDRSRAGASAPFPALVIACDTVVALEATNRESRILGKPRDREEAAAMLDLLRGRSHLVYSAVTVLDSVGRAATTVAETRLTMRSYTDSELAAYVASGDPLDKAGAYAIQHEGFHPVREIAGCYASVMGLPLCHLTRSLRRWRVSPATDVPTACQAYTGHRCLAKRAKLSRSPIR
jgi:MAF protein